MLHGNNYKSTVLEGLSPSLFDLAELYRGGTTLFQYFGAFVFVRARARSYHGLCTQFTGTSILGRLEGRWGRFSLKIKQSAGRKNLQQSRNSESIGHVDKSVLEVISVKVAAHRDISKRRFTTP